MLLRNLDAMLTSILRLRFYIFFLPSPIKQGEEVAIHMKLCMLELEIEGRMREMNCIALYHILRGYLLTTDDGGPLSGSDKDKIGTV